MAQSNFSGATLADIGYDGAAWQRRRTLAAKRPRFERFTEYEMATHIS